MVTTLFALVDKDGVFFGCRRKKGSYVISCGKRSEACGNHDFPQNSTFLRMVIMVKLY